MKVLTVAGSPSQRLTTLPVRRALRADHESIFVRAGRRGDGCDPLGTALDERGPSVRLGTGGAGHAEQTATLLRDLDDVVARESPDVVLVAGDTSATLAGALVGAKRDALVAHVEGGLRRHDRDGSSELDRVLTDHCSGVLFVPSERATARLAAAGITDGVHEVGDVTCDAMLAVRERARDRSTALDEVDHEPGSFVLASLQRRRSVRGDWRQSLRSGLADAPLPVVVPTHPRTECRFDRRLGNEALPETVDAVETETYLDYVWLVDAAERVVTDAARVQKEAFHLDTPCLTLAETTPWIETVEAGWNVLVGTRADAIRRNLRRSFRRTEKPQPYGDGNAARRIVDRLESAVATATTDEQVGSAVP
ncbi:UDP-N-acetyl glucosamine 2-epimerase (plasmid) [Halorientalis pallida]|uniref:UDP-N-acetyl glucosamine 2-epimerase n=1 Tax=Halorientalis pallida TaxID=2479928 RepID=UPI003C6F7ED4